LPVGGMGFTVEPIIWILSRGIIKVLGIGYPIKKAIKTKQYGFFHWGKIKKMP
jgi:hypothetical protein